MSRPKVMVNVLNMGTTSAGLETQLMQWMTKMSDRYEFRVFLPSHRPIPANRNQIVKDFLAGDWEYLVMVDDDTMPRKNFLELLDLDLDVVGGVYPGRDKRGIQLHAYKMSKNDKGEYVFNQFPPEEREGLKQVGAIGTGLIVIKRRVLEKIVKKGWPPFEDTFHKDGTFWYSDDMSFCIKCHKLGIPVYVHWDYIGSHWKMVDLLWVADLVAYAAQTGRTNFPNE